MAKLKHTPGPWIVQDNTSQGDGSQLRVDSPAGAVADLGRAPFVSEEARANAQLIAAAPELLAALEMLLVHATTKGGIYTDGGADMIRATLATAKAEGSSNA